MKEKTLFIKFIGDTPYVRILDFLITGREFDYTLTDMANKAGISWTTLNRVFPEFIKNRIVKETRAIGRARLYKLNLENEIVKRMVNLYDLIILNRLGEIGSKHKIKAVA